MISIVFSVNPLTALNPLEWGATTYVLLIAASILLRALVPASTSHVARFAREFLLIMPAALLYFLVRGMVDAREADAVRNAGRIIDAERLLGMYRERELQSHILGSDILVDLVNWVYIWAHWPLIVLIMLWLIFFHHERFAMYRNAFLIAGAVGIVIFALYPVAPPRLLNDAGFIDTVTNRSHSYRVLQPPSLTNPYAAMPSLHFGWNLLLGIAVLRESRHWAAKLFGVIMPMAMFLSIVFTANHYFLDGIVGAAIVLLSLAISVQWPAMFRAASGTFSIRLLTSHSMRERRGVFRKQHSR